MRNRYKLLLVVSTLLLTFAFAFQQPVASDVFNPFQTNYNTESTNVYDMVDEKGQSIQKTGMTIYVGDEFISQDNKRYRVISVKGNIARAKFIGVEKMDFSEDKKTMSTGDVAAAANTTKGQKIDIYHTHSDESYVPSDGSASILAHGGIYKVGDAMTSALKSKGFEVDHNTTPHDPHDANAYSRSRRTAFDLLKGRPNALIDLHRDATPPEVYKRTIAGQDVAGVKLVVGRQNPKMNANLDFAKKVKSVADKTHPNLVTGIFLAKGDYNQDLGNRALLLEIGSHTNTREEAERGARLFADVMPEALKGTGTMALAGGFNYSPTRAEAGGVWRAVLWVLGLAIVGGGLFLLIATGSFKGAVEKLRQFKNVEFANYFGPRPKVKDKDNEEEKDDDGFNR